MNGDQAERQFQRIQELKSRSKSDCFIEPVIGELDSVHVTFHCGGKRFSKAWTGAWLATLDDKALVRELDIATQGGIREADQWHPTEK
jgi:hypothetical protein